MKENYIFCTSLKEKGEMLLKRRLWQGVGRVLGTQINRDAPETGISQLLSMFSFLYSTNIPSSEFHLGCIPWATLKSSLRKTVGEAIENGARKSQRTEGRKTAAIVAFSLYLWTKFLLFLPFCSTYHCQQSSWKLQNEYLEHTLVLFLYYCSSCSLKPELSCNISPIIWGFDSSIWSMPHVLSK